MTRDEIIRMALEAGIDYSFGDELHRFAYLVATAKSQKLYVEIMELRSEIEQLRAAVLAEREACAQLCEDDGLLWGQRYAAAIRERGER